MIKKYLVSIDFSDKKAKHYYIKADTRIEDYNSLNNFKYIVVYPDIELTHSDEEMREFELINVTEVNIESQDITLILSDKDKVANVLSAVVFPRNATYQCEILDFIFLEVITISIL
ncbi:MAG: hypothetical protein HFI34_00025 [Lachnospiraceae bacterium]|nr:hypothetical protein [Lachnospiraceae bacterium]